MVNEPQVIVGSKYLETVAGLVAEARQSVDLIVFQLRMHPTRKSDPATMLLRALQDAALRGVRIRAICGSEGIRELLRQVSIEARVLYVERLVHAKVILIDDTVAVVGSHNLTQSAMQRNVEVSLVVHFSTRENDLSLYFRNLWGL